ncbi:hypothetical protein OJ593_10865, partial [Streptococcus anginosus]|nr:hypothetical protein [Streptococcus anginosus]
ERAAGRSSGDALAAQEARGACEARQKTLFFAAVALKLTALLRRGKELEARNYLTCGLGAR